MFSKKIVRFSEFINRFDTNGSLFVSERGGGSPERDEGAEEEEEGLEVF